MKRVLITGSNGLLGQKIVDLFSTSSPYNLQLTSRQERSVFTDESLPYSQLDTSDRQKVVSAVEGFEPNVIIHTAAMTDVDKCEIDREGAWRSNVVSVENLSLAAKLVGAHIVHLSTDYVFDGTQGPYSEKDRPNPLSYYGRTKLASENVLHTSGISYTIVRTMVLYGTGVGVKSNFALWLLKNLEQEKPVRVVDDQIGNPTLVDDLAYGILKIVELNRSGTYHISGPDIISRYHFALLFAEIFGYKRELITSIKTSLLKQKAPRPLKSGFIILKAMTDLGLNVSGARQGLSIFKSQLALFDDKKSSLF